jgi:iron(III) transport system substrate-binding protein
MNLRQTTRFSALFFVLVMLAACTAPPGPIEPATQANSASATTIAEASPVSDKKLVIYSGRNENLVGPLIERFRDETGVDVQVRYGETAEMAATILEEGDNSPADVFFGQDAGALGALAQEGRLATLPDDLLAQVDPRFRSKDGQWVGTSGRARVLVYNTEQVQTKELPQDIWGLTDPKWKGNIGWAPSNGSFQAFVTALRVVEGDAKAEEWLAGMIKNDAKVYANNDAIVAAVASGEIASGLVNHYYMYRYQAEHGGNVPIANHYFPAGGAGALLNVAGAGVLSTSQRKDTATQFIAFLLSNEAQQYFAGETDEYPLVGQNIQTNPAVKPLSEIASPDIDLSNLNDLQGTLELLQRVGALN